MRTIRRGAPPGTVKWAPFHLVSKWAPPTEAMGVTGGCRACRACGVMRPLWAVAGVGARCVAVDGLGKIAGVSSFLSLVCVMRPFLPAAVRCWVGAGWVVAG